MTVATIAQAAAATIDPDDPSTFPISVDDVIRGLWDASNRIEYQAGRFRWKCAEIIASEVQDHGRKKKDVAELIGKSPSHITFILKAWNTWVAASEADPTLTLPDFNQAYQDAKKSTRPRKEITAKVVDVDPMSPETSEMRERIDKIFSHDAEAPEELYPQVKTQECDCGDPDCEYCGPKVAEAPKAPEVFKGYADTISDALEEMFRETPFTDQDWIKARKYLKDLVAYRLGDKIQKTMPRMPEF